MFWKPPNWPKTSPNLFHPPKPIFTRTIKFKTAGNPPNLATLHGSLFRYQASGSVNSSSARALCGIGFAAYVATFLVGILHLPLSRSYLASLEKASPTQTWPAGRLRSHELEDTCTNADGWHEWKWFQIGDVVFGFPTRSIAQNTFAECRINCIFLPQTCQSKGNAVYGVWGNLWISIDL